MFLICIISFSQPESKQVLSGALDFGVFIPGEVDSKTGFNLGADLEAWTNKFGLYFNFSSNFSKEKESSPPYGRNIILMEIYGGPRWLIGNLKKINGTIEAGLGYNRFYYDDGGSDGDMGFNIGAGLSMPVSNRFDIGIKGKYYILGRNLFTSYAEIYCWARYYFVK